MPDVIFRFVPRPGASVSRVTLLGEATDWRNGVKLKRGDDGAFQVTLPLPVGVYRYKFLVDDQWQLDPAEPRTVSADGQRNSVRVVGGSAEPFVFAPAMPFVEDLAGQGVRVFAGLRKALPNSVVPSVRLAADASSLAQARSEPLSQIWEDDEHTWWSKVLPWSAKRCVLSLVAGAHDSGPMPFERPSAEHATPAWLRDASLYTVFVDRFRPEKDREGWNVYRRSTEALGGHLEGVRRSLTELDELGVNTLYLTPVHLGQSAHRYDFVDALTVDPALGGAPAFRALVADAHMRGMRIIVDFAFSHAGEGFPPAADVLAHGAASRYAPWFRWSQDSVPKLLHYGRRERAPLLDLEHKDVQELVFAAVEFWARLGVDGLRLDMAAEMPFSLGRAIRRQFMQLRTDGAVFGEVVPLHAWRWRQEEVVHASTDFAFFEAMTRVFARGEGNLETLARALDRGGLLRGGDATSNAIRFLSTHDHPRFASLSHAQAAKAANKESARADLELPYLLLFTLPGIPMLLYGEEVGLFTREAESELEDVWPDRMPMVWDGPLRDLGLREHLRSLIHLRKTHSALRQGTFEWLHVQEDLLLFRRRHGDEVVDVLVSMGAAEDRDIEIEDDAMPQAEVLYASGGASLEGNVALIPPRGAMVLARSARSRAEQLAPRVTRNLQLLDEDMSAGRTSALSFPSRIDFAVTERCNLSCVHCITHAPDKTKSGQARTMTSATLDALRESLPYARYFGFVHGGESLTAPMLWEVLAAIKDARAQLPYVAHVLSNGLLLQENNVLRLYESGVRSISVSLDGATANTNDAIRQGGRFDAVVRNVENASKLRAGSGLDLRLGLSFVIMSENVNEVLPFVELAARLRVDWVKFEELVPVSERAKRSLLVDPAAKDRTAQVLLQAKDRAKALGLVLVDHTLDRMLYRCRLSAEEAAFLEADSFANRSEIHPCRSPWETACIEPNGDVRLNDFFGPVLGNVTEAPLAMLWNEVAAQDLRQRAVLTRLCGPGPATCLTPRVSR